MLKLKFYFSINYRKSDFKYSYLVFKASHRANSALPESSPNEDNEYD